MDRYYKAGELAKIAGVSSRTIRYYDEKGILKPISYSEEEYRLYDNNSVIVLQQILMLKYVGFSLEEISEIIKQDKEISLKHILEKQKILMFQKKTQIEQIIYALDSAVKVCEKSSPDLQHFTEIMQLITKNDFADRRYGFYERFSSRQEEWYQWRLENLELRENMQILDVGGGYGTPWMRVWEQIPAGCNIVMLDKDNKGREFLKEFLNKNGHRLASNVTFTFWNADAETVSYEALKYDRILANHFWGYVNDKVTLMKKLRIALKLDGRLYSTVPSMVSEEDVEKLVENFLHKNINTELNVKKVEEQQYIETCLKQCFSSVDNRFFVNPLFINDAEAIYQYLCDSDNNLQQILEKRRTDFMKYLRKRLAKEENIRINVKGHMYVCER